MTQIILQMVEKADTSYKAVEILNVEVAEETLTNNRAVITLRSTFDYREFSFCFVFVQKQILVMVLEKILNKLQEWFLSCF